MKFDFEQQPGLEYWDRPLVKDEKPLISIITPYYNSGKYFEQTFNCVIDQTFPWFEWIIIDDGSTDPKSLELLELLGKKDQRIKIIHQENSGASSARNAGIVAATTDYIFPLDSDDLIEPTCLEYEYWALKTNPKATWAYSNSIGFQGEEYLWEDKFDPDRMKRQNHLTVTALIRKSAALEVGMYTVQKFPFDEDWHFWLKLMEKGGFPVQITGEYLFWYRRGQTGVFASVRKNSSSIKRNKELIEKQAQFVIDPPKPVIYPLSSWEGYKTPELSEWDQYIYKKHTKIHILFVFPWLAMGGADKFNIDLLEGLDKDKYDVSVITTDKSNNEWIQRFRKITPEVFNLPNFLSPTDYPEFISYFIKSRQIDVLFVSNSTDGYYLLPWIRQHFPKLAILDYVHMEEWYWRNGGHARSSSIFGNITERTYVCNSETRNVMIKHFGRKSQDVETVHIGIDEEYFDASRIPSGMLYKELGLEKGRPIVLFICRLSPQKRPFLMLKIAEQVKQQIENVAFVVIGDGPQENELKDKTIKMGLEETIYFLGAKKEVRPYYKDAKITLICSMKEGLTLTAYESCAMGVPVVSADVGGQKDLIDETVGALIPYMQNEEKDFDSRTFPKKEIELYKSAIIDILSNENKWCDLSEECRAKVVRAFTIKNMIQYFDSEIQRIVNDLELQKTRERKSLLLNELNPVPGEMYTLCLQDGWTPQMQKAAFYGSISTAAVEGTLGSHAEVLNRHEEVLNRHEEVVNRHENSINHQWEIQKWHEERLQRLEKRTFRYFVKKLIGR